MAVDMGAAICVLAPQLAWALGIHAGAASGSVSLTTASGVLQVPVVSIPEVGVGGAKGGCFILS